MAIIVIIYIAHAQWCLHSTSCLDRTGSVQFVQEVHTINNEIMITARPHARREI